MKRQFDFIVVGCGIVGATAAYKLGLKYPDKTIAVFDKEDKPGSHQTGRNSGVIHSGIYYKPGSLKAENCRNGREQLVSFAQKHKIAHRICGKIIVAVNEKELKTLEKIYNNGLKNQTTGIKYLDKNEIEEYEPFIKGIKAIWVPTAGIIDYVAIVRKCIELLQKSNRDNRLFLRTQIRRFKRDQDHIIVETNKGSFKAGRVVVCGGLQADRLAAMDGLKLDMQIVGFRGDYFELKDEAKHKVKNLVYPVPDPKYPFLGVHYTPMINGKVECGPNAVFTFKREGYKKTSFSFKDSMQALTFIGTYKLFAKNWVKGLEEYRRAFSKKLFLKELQRMMPSITEREVMATRSGVRAQAVGLQGEMIDDFKVIKNKGVIHVINAPSPAATACLSIADEIIDNMQET